MDGKFNSYGYYWDNRLFFVILLSLCVPSIYNSYSLYLVGNTLPTQDGLAIVAQWQFVQVIMEVVQEAAIFPIFYFVGRNIGEERTQLPKRIWASLFIMLAILMPILALLSLGMHEFVDRIGTTKSLQTETVVFLRIKMGALFLGVLNAGLVVIIEALRKTRLLLRLLFLKLLFALALDSLFYGGYEFSLSWGIKGVAISNLFAEFMFSIFVFYSLYQYFDKGQLAGYKNRLKSMIPEKKDFQLFGEISGWVALESLIRNAAYLFVVIQLINTMGSKHISGYYLAMHLFWSFALLPISALTETMRVLIANIANTPSGVRMVLFKGLSRGAIIISLWLIPLFFLDKILAFFSKDLEVIALARKTVSLLLLPYIMLALNILVDSLFIGLGKTKYLALQSIVTNVGVYGVAFFAYQLGWWLPSYSSVLLLFSISIFVDSVLTTVYAKKVLTHKAT